MNPYGVPPPHMMRGMPMGMPPMMGMPGMMPPGPMGMMGMGRGAPPSMSAPPGLGPLGPKAPECIETYTVFVSKLGDVEDTLISRILQLCGTVKKWNRPKNSTGGHKGFGVADFEGPEAAMRVIRLLNNLQMGEHTLGLKMSEDMNKKLEAYKEKAESQRMNGAETPPERLHKDTAAQTLINTLRDEYTRRKQAEKNRVAMIQAQQETAAAAAAAAAPPAQGAEASTVEAVDVEGAPSVGPPPGMPPPALPPPAALSEADRLQALMAQEAEERGERLAKGQVDEVLAADTSAADAADDKPLSKEEARRAAEDKKYEEKIAARKAEKKKDEERQRERNFKERERRWDEREKAKARERERDVERESRKAKTNAQRHTRTETDLVAEEQDVEEGRRGADRERERRRRERRRKRDDELVQDAADRSREKEEVVEAEERLKLEEEAAKKRQEEEVERKKREEEEEGERIALLQAVAEANPEVAAAAAVSGPPAKPEQEAPETKVAQSSAPKSLSKPIGKAKTKTKVPKKRRAVFGEEEVETKRKLVKLEYTKEEADVSAVRMSAEDARSAAKAAAEAINKRHNKTVEDPHARAKRIVNSIPKDKAELYALEVDWAALEGGDCISKKMVPWITKKVTEYFGEPEQSVIDFVVEELNNKHGATTLVENLGPILESDCEDFVFKLWRLLMFEMLSATDTGAA